MLSKEKDGPATESHGNVCQIAVGRLVGVLFFGGEGSRGQCPRLPSREVYFQMGLWPACAGTQTGLPQRMKMMRLTSSL